MDALLPVRPQNAAEIRAQATLLLVSRPSFHHLYFNTCSGSLECRLGLGPAVLQIALAVTGQSDLTNHRKVCKPRVFMQVHVNASVCTVVSGILEIHALALFAVGVPAEQPLAINEMLPIDRPRDLAHMMYTVNFRKLDLGRPARRGTAWNVVHTRPRESAVRCGSHCSSSTPVRQCRCRIITVDLQFKVSLAVTDASACVDDVACALHARTCSLSLGSTM